jgi:hypothetical protein
MVVQHQHRRFILGGILLAALLLLVACNSGNGNKGSNSPLLVTPKSSSGSPGHGPTIITTPSPVPNGPSGSQQVVLSDRTLIIYSVVAQKSASTNFVIVNLDLAVDNTSQTTIMNQSSFFQLIGSEGDSFGSNNSSDDFYGTIDAQTTRRGNIVFQIPAGAASKLSLLYRPETATEATLILLKTSS